MEGKLQAKQLTKTCMEPLTEPKQIGMLLLQVNMQSILLYKMNFWQPFVACRLTKCRTQPRFKLESLSWRLWNQLKDKPPSVISQQLRHSLLCGMPINQVQDSALLQTGITLLVALEPIEGDKPPSDEFLAALCGMLINQVQDSALLQTGITLLAALEPIEGQAALCHFPAASSFATALTAAHSLTPSFSVANPPLLATPAPEHSATPARPSSSTLLMPIIPAAISKETIPLSTLPPASSPLPAIPVIFPLHAVVPRTWWLDEASQASSKTISHSSRLQAQASPWKPENSALPSLLVGDIPFSPTLTSSSETPHSPLTDTLLLSGARQSLTTPYPDEILDVDRSCFYCANQMHSPHHGPTSAIPYGFSPLRGRNGAHQVQKSNVTVHHGVDPAWRSTRP